MDVGGSVGILIVYTVGELGIAVFRAVCHRKCFGGGYEDLSAQKIRVPCSRIFVKALSCELDRGYTVLLGLCAEDVADERNGILISFVIAIVYNYRIRAFTNESVFAFAFSHFPELILDDVIGSLEGELKLIVFKYVRLVIDEVRLGINGVAVSYCTSALNTFGIYRNDLEGHSCIDVILLWNIGCGQRVGGLYKGVVGLTVDSGVYSVSFRSVYCLP